MAGFPSCVKGIVRPPDARVRKKGFDQLEASDGGSLGELLVTMTLGCWAPESDGSLRFQQIGQREAACCQVTTLTDFDLAGPTTISQLVVAQETAAEDHLMPLLPLLQFHARERLEQEPVELRHP